MYGTENFAKEETYYAPIAVADFNRDGYLDIVSAYRWDRGTPIYRQQLYLTKATGSSSYNPTCLHKAVR